MNNQHTYRPDEASVTFEVAIEDAPTARFYMRRELPGDGHVYIHDGEGAMHRMAVHEHDVDFVCAAMNAADRQAKLCKV